MAGEERLFSLYRWMGWCTPQSKLWEAPALPKQMNFLKTFKGCVGVGSYPYQIFLYIEAIFDHKYPSQCRIRSPLKQKVFRISQTKINLFPKFPKKNVFQSNFIFLKQIFFSPN